MKSLSLAHAPERCTAATRVKRRTTPASVSCVARPSTLRLGTPGCIAGASALDRRIERSPSKQARPNAVPSGSPSLASGLTVHGHMISFLSRLVGRSIHQNSAIQSAGPPIASRAEAARNRARDVLSSARAAGRRLAIGCHLKQGRSTVISAPTVTCGVSLAP